MPLDQRHFNTQKQLLIHKLLDCREDASPFTLIFDSLEQPAKPLLGEYMSRAKLSKTKVIFASFETLRAPQNANDFILAYNSDPAQVHQSIKAAAAAAVPNSKTLKAVFPIGDEPKITHTVLETLIILDTLRTLLSQHPDNVNISTYLSSLIAPSISLLAVYHMDQPLPIASGAALYQPAPLTLLKFLATTIMTTHALPQVSAAKVAQERAVVGPAFGLGEEEEGVLQGLANGPGAGDVVVEVDTRRKSGREVHLAFVLSKRAPVNKGRTQMTLLEDHEIFARSEPAAVTNVEDDAGVTFNLALTDKQRRDREAVVHPYFDAQREGYQGEGGRILYDIGREDDFDEEEDEI